METADDGRKKRGVADQVIYPIATYGGYMKRKKIHIKKNGRSTIIHHALGRANRSLRSGPIKRAFTVSIPFILIPPLTPVDFFFHPIRKPSYIYQERRYHRFATGHFLSGQPPRKRQKKAFVLSPFYSIFFFLLLLFCPQSTMRF